MAVIKFHDDLYRYGDEKHDRNTINFQLNYCLKEKKIGNDFDSNTWFNGVRQDNIDNMIYDLSIPSIFREFEGKQPLKRDYSMFAISWKKGDIEQENVIDTANEIVRNFLTEYDEKGNIIFDGKDAIYLMTSHLDQANGNPHVHVICSKVNPISGETFDILQHQNRVYKLREISDKVCQEHNLPVIDNPRRFSSITREEYYARRHNKSFKGQLEQQIEEGLKVVTTFSELVEYLKERLDVDEKSLLGNPNYINIKMPGSQVYTRLRALSIDYNYSSLIDRLAHKEESEKVVTTSEKEVTTFSEESNNPKYIDVTKEKIANSPGLRRWADKQNLQAAAARLRASNEVDKAGTSIKELKEKKLEIKSVIEAKDYDLNSLNEMIGKLTGLKKTLDVEWKLAILPVLSKYKKMTENEAKNAFKRQNYKYFKKYDEIKKLAQELGVYDGKTVNMIENISKKISKTEKEYHTLYTERKELNSKLNEINKLLVPTQLNTDITKKYQYRSKKKSKDDVEH